MLCRLQVPGNFELLHFVLVVPFFATGCMVERRGRFFRTASKPYDAGGRLALLERSKIVLKLSRVKNNARQSNSLLEYHTLHSEARPLDDRHRSTGSGYVNQR